MTIARLLPKTEYDVIAIVHRFFSEGKRKKGGFDKVLEYFSQRGKTILLIEHPLTALREGRNECSETIVSVIKSEGMQELCRVSLHKGPNVLNWAKEVNFNISCIKALVGNSPVFMVTDPLNGVAGILCRKKFSRLYYHCVDYSVSRFGNAFLDSVYRFLFMLNLKVFDVLGIVSFRVRDALEKKYPACVKKIFYLPNSPVFKKISVKEKKSNVLICTGGAILEKYAYEFVVDLVAALKKDFGNIKLYAVGGLDEDPEYVKKLKRKIKRLGLEENVTFTGFLLPKDLKYLLLEAKIGLSFYSSNVLYYMYYGDPLKVREYALYGIPSITDGVTSADEEMLAEEAGFVVKGLRDARKKVALLLNDATIYKTYQTRCMVWAKKLDKEKLLEGLYDKIFEDSDFMPKVRADQKKVILNFGCGDTAMEGAINIDHIKLPNVDMAFDFETFPYPFDENSVDEIHMYFVLEHLVDHLAVMRELYRILKPGGMLYIRVPHGSSCYGAWGEFTHRRGYSYGSFDLFCDTSPRAYYTDVRFKTVFKKCKYFLTYPYDFYKYNTWFPHWEHKWYGFLVKSYVLTVQSLIDMSPEIFERFWCYWVGGAAEVYVELQKAET